jgi:hypothetical protein
MIVSKTVFSKMERKDVCQANVRLDLESLSSYLDGFKWHADSSANKKGLPRGQA